MVETPIIRLAACLYAQENCGLPMSDPMFQSELEFFYQEHRAPRIDKITLPYVQRAQEAFNYAMRE